MNKRGKDHVWEILRFLGDLELYARCKCGYEYGCSLITNSPDGLSVVPDSKKLYPYCPYCGAHKKYYTSDIKKVDR